MGQPVPGQQTGELFQEWTDITHASPLVRLELGKRVRLPQVVESDIAFHRALVDSLGSPRLSRLYVSLMGEFHLCMAQVQVHELLDPKTIAAEHAAIVAAVEAGDPARAVAEIDAHLQNASKRIVAFYEKAGDLDD